MVRSIKWNAQTEKYCRLWIGHAGSNPSYRIENRPHTPICSQCEANQELRVKQILIDDDFLKTINDIVWICLKELFDTVSSKTLFDCG